MVIILENNNNNPPYPHHQKKPSQPLQEKNIKSQSDPISSKQQLTNQPLKDILVTADLEEYLPVLGKKIIKHYTDKNKKRQQDGTIHIFEIINCLRQSLILQQYPEEIEGLSIWDTTNFDHGLNSEGVLVNIMESQKDEGVSTEYQYDIDFSGISGHPDYIEGDWVFELKSVNKFKPLILSDSSVSGYIKQVVYYMILMDIEKGRVIVKYNMPFFPELVTYDTDELKKAFPKFFMADGLPMYKLAFHKEEGQFPYFTFRVDIPLDAPIRQKVKDGLLNILKPMYKEGDITKIPRLDGALDNSNWKCAKYCKAREICMEIPDEQYDTQIKDVLLNKHIDEQVHRKRVYGKRMDKDVVLI
jgi:hypothetical protein